MSVQYGFAEMCLGGPRLKLGYRGDVDLEAIGDGKYVLCVGAAV